MNKVRSSRYQNYVKAATVVFVVLFFVAVLVTIVKARQPVRIEWAPKSGPTRSIVWAIAVDPDDPDVLYVGTNGGGVYKSENRGETWEQRNQGLESAQGQYTGIERARNIRDILISRIKPGWICAATWGPEGIYCSEDAGKHWRAHFPDPIDPDLVGKSVYVRTLAETDEYLFAGTGAGVFRFVDPPDDPEEPLWEPTALQGITCSVRALVVHPIMPDTLYAATLGQGVYQSSDGGETWRPKNNGLDGGAALDVNALAVDPASPNILYAGTFGKGVYRSTDGGEHWEAWNGDDEKALPENVEVWSLAFSQDTLFAGLRYNGTYKLVDERDWVQVGPIDALSLAYDPQTAALYAGTWGGGVYRIDQEAGDAWISLGLPFTHLRLRDAVFVGRNPALLYTATDSDGVYVSEDGGEQWARHSEGLSGGALGTFALAVDRGERKLYVGTGEGVYINVIGDKRWYPIGSTTRPEEFTVISLAAGADKNGHDIVYAGTQGGLWFFDAREVWQEVPGSQGDLVAALLAEGQEVYAGQWGQGFKKSTYHTDSELPFTEWEHVVQPNYVDALRFAKNGRLYGLTERGIYGPVGHESWSVLYPGSVTAMTTDPRHPQVIYAALKASPIEIVADIRTPDGAERVDEDAGSQDPNTAPLTYTEEIITSIPLTTTELLVSLNHGRAWQKAGFIEERANFIARDPDNPRRIFALSAEGGLYRGTLHLPWLIKDVVVGWSVGLLAFGALVLLPYSYVELKRKYNLHHRQVRELLLHPQMLRKVQSQRFKHQLTPLEKLLLAAMDQAEFKLVDVWARLREIGVPARQAQLATALAHLADTGVLQECKDVFAYAPPALQAVIQVEFEGDRFKLIDATREQNRILSEVERFFEAAGFDVAQDAPRHLTHFVLQPRLQQHRQRAILWHAWLCAHETLKEGDIDAICGEIAPEPAGGANAPVNRQIAFLIVKDLPGVDVLRQIRTWQPYVRLIPLSIYTIRSALREHTAARDLDRLVQVQRIRSDVYDIRTPLIDPLDFFGQGETLKRLHTALQRGQSMDIVGLPSIGKTSLLWYLKETLVNPLVAYVDMGYGWQGETLVEEQLLADLVNDLLIKYNRLPQALEGDFAVRVNTILQAMPPRQGNEAHIVLLLDGVSGALLGAAQQRWLEQLRSLAEGDPYLILFVAKPEAKLSGGSRVLLTALTEMESHHLLSALGIQLGLTFTPESLDTIAREAFGHPMLLRQLGSAVAQTVAERPATGFIEVTRDHATQALDTFHRVRDAYLATLADEWLAPDRYEVLRPWAQMDAAERERLVKAHADLQVLFETSEDLGTRLIWWILENT